MKKITAKQFQDQKLRDEGAFEFSAQIQKKSLEFLNIFKSKKYSQRRYYYDLQIKIRFWMYETSSNQHK